MCFLLLDDLSIHSVSA